MRKKGSERVMLPDFLLGETKPLSESSKRLRVAMERYKEHFGDGVNTEPSTWTVDEWVDALNNCVETDTPFNIMFNIPEGDDIDF